MYCPYDSLRLVVCTYPSSAPDPYGARQGRRMVKRNAPLPEVEWTRGLGGFAGWSPVLDEDEEKGEHGGDEEDGLHEERCGPDEKRAFQVRVSKTPTRARRDVRDAPISKRLPGIVKEREAASQQVVQGPRRGKPALVELPS